MLESYRAAPPAVLKAAYKAKSDGGWLRTPSGQACEEVMIERGFLQKEEDEIISAEELARMKATWPAAIERALAEVS